MTMANTMRSGAGRRRGFTLIELMVVVSIVAILAAIALPSYRAQIAKSRRAEARAQLTEVAQYMQRYYSQNDRYDQSNAATPVALALPDLLTRVPKGAASGAQNYTISFVTNSLTANAYTLQAVPRTGGLMAGDRCGTLSITHLGRRATSAGTTADWIKECWS